MQKTHPFIFKPGNWLGEGTITLSMLADKLSFFTRWSIPPPDKGGRIESVQEIQISGFSDVMLNQFSFYEIASKNFTIELENQSLGKVVGQGLVNSEVVGWEFRLPQLGFEGFEFYELTSDQNTYHMHAEYATNDDQRTVIHGKIWQQFEKSF